MSLRLDNPTVSVLMITYNHEKYIEQAINSVLCQSGVGSVELVIGEDCSTDQTRRIVQRYSEKYADQIRLILANKNQGPGRNFRATYNSCRGKYIAVLEGDDWWVDSSKLARQVKVMESHPEYVGCFHRVKYCNDRGEWDGRMYPPDDQANKAEFADLLDRNSIQTCSG